VGVAEQVRVLRLMRILAKADKDSSESLNDILAQASGNNIFGFQGSRQQVVVLCLLT